MKLTKIAWIAPFFLIPLLDIGLDMIFSSYHQAEPEVTGIESELAHGNPISLKKASLLDLELIPGISSDTAGEILNNREMIISKAKELSYNSKHESLEIAKGIGEKKSISFKKYLDLD